MIARAEPLPPGLFDVDAFCRQLDSECSIACCKPAISVATEYLHACFLDGTEAGELLTLRAQFMDALLGALWDKQQWQHSDLALVAVGGYGRGELHPASDVDVQILLKDDEEHHNDALEKFITFLWDIGLAIGHSVRTLDECIAEATADITVATNLQEGRLLFGPEELFNKQRKLCAPDKIWPSKDFFQAKLNEQITRHQKYDDTAYNLEPNIKESRGGLRDIQMIGWVAKRHFNANSLRDLVKENFLLDDELNTLLEGQHLLWRIRCSLHYLAGRREDRLLFDYQRDLAEEFGF